MTQSKAQKLEKKIAEKLTSKSENFAERLSLCKNKKMQPKKIGHIEKNRKLKKIKMENQNMSTIRIHALAMNARIANALNSDAIVHYIKESLEDVINKGKDKKLTFTIKAVCDIKTDETIEFETWSEVTCTEKDTSEKIGETFDLKQVTMNFGE